MQDLKTEFSKEVDTLKRTHNEMKIELKNQITELENSQESLISRMSQSEDRNIKTCRKSRGSRPKKQGIWKNT